MLRAGGRLPPLVDARSPDARAAIRAAFERGLAPYAVDGGLEVPTSIQVTAAGR